VNERAASNNGAEIFCIMKEAELGKRAFAMPLTSHGFPRGPYCLRLSGPKISSKNYSAGCSLEEARLYDEQQ
jgi:hypothetical protein